MQKIEYELDNDFLLKDEHLRNERMQHVKLEMRVYNILHPCCFSYLTDDT